jgi:opacity protein-like surface antigen
MKKVVLVSLMMVLALGFAYAQSIYGLRGGVNFSNYGGDPDMDSKIGFNFGMMMQYDLHPMLILQPELNYTQRGAQTEGSILGVDFERKDTLHYAELPIYLKLDMAEGDFKIQPYLGPELRYLIKGNSKIEIGDDENDEDIEDLKSLDYGLGIGLDIVFNTNILAGIRYSLGLANIADTDDDITNNSLMLNLGFLY